jgi:hypothetical protein
VGNGHELIQSRLTEDGDEEEVDLHDVEDDALRTVVLRRPESHQEGDATTWDDGAQTDSRE